VSRGLGDVYKRQGLSGSGDFFGLLAKITL